MTKILNDKLGLAFPRDYLGLGIECKLPESLKITQEKIYTV